MPCRDTHQWLGVFLELLRRVRFARRWLRGGGAARVVRRHLFHQVLGRYREGTAVGVNLLVECAFIFTVVHC